MSGKLTPLASHPGDINSPRILGSRARSAGRRVVALVLAELAGIVAEIDQELGDRRRAGSQVGRAARSCGGIMPVRNGPCGSEGVAPRSAGLLGLVVAELRAFLTHTVNVGRLSDHQALVVDARLHPADIIAHDEDDVWLRLRLLRGYGCARHRDGGK